MKPDFDTQMAELAAREKPCENCDGRVTPK